MTELLVFGVDGLSNDVIQLLGKEKLPTIHKLQENTETYGDYESYIVDGYDVPHTGPCLTPDVKAYTKEGLKTYEEINVGDQVLSIAPDQTIEWKKVTEVMTREHNGTVHDIEHSKVSGTVTDDHNIAIRNKDGEIERLKASLTPSTFEIPTHGKQGITGLDGNKNMAFAEFLGWFIADGNINKNEIRISKTIPEDVERIKENIVNLGSYEPSVRDTNICFYEPDLAEELKEEVGKYSTERRIPKKYLERWSKDKLEKLYETLMSADGSRTERNKYHTSSRQLAYDFAELAIRLGKSPHIENRGGGTHEIKGEEYNVEDRYRVHIAREENNTEIRKHRHWNTREYKGKVWDIEVEDNHTFLAERNGKLHFTGNCWTSIYTGLKPEQHGMTEGGWRDGDSHFHELSTVWDKLSQDTDKQLALYGMPMTYRAKQIQGWMVSGFVHTTLKSMYDNCLYPSDLLDNNFIENTASYTANVKLEEGCHPKMPEEPEKALETLWNSEKNRLEKFKELIQEKEKPDIAAYGTTFADKIGHCAGINPTNDATKEAYKKVDHMLSELIETLNPENIVIISDHGFSGYSHDELGYYLDTTGEGMTSVFDFTPWLLNQHNLEYREKEYGPDGELKGLSEEEKDQMKDQLSDLGYI